MFLINNLLYNLFCNCRTIGFCIFISLAFASPLSYAKSRLSEYNFFKEPIAKHIPNENVLPYDLPTPLFSDYSYKARFIVLPENKSATYIDENNIEFPVGTTIIKTFYYPQDFRNPDSNWNIMETRLLINTSEGWIGYPYVWNIDQSDAYLEITGGRKEVSWINNKGHLNSINYKIPNFNMCKDCHVKNNIVQPIGPKPRNLNTVNTYGNISQNQLEKMIDKNMIQNVPDLDSLTSTAEWNNNEFNLNDRAMAYLDMNCAHCHNYQGPASTSGLFLDYHERDKKKLGIYKSPIAAGRGSGGHLFNIVPGKPDESIFIFRMESIDPGILMPESGRQLVHEEGVQLIREWIKSLKN